MKINETKSILAEILKTPFGEICVVKVQFGSGENVVQRCRVELSRLRNRAIKRHGRNKVPKFKLKADVERKSGVAFDVIKFVKIRETDVVVDMSDLDKIVEEIIDENQKDIEATQEAAKKGVVIKVKQGAM